MKRHAHRDPVTPELRLEVLERDQGCVYPLVEGLLVEGWAVGIYCAGRLTLDHVQDGYGRMGKRAPSDMAHLVTLCEHHHIMSGWATSHRPELREYLRRVNADTDSTIPPTSKSGEDIGRA
jgi:hypothetical protein